MPARPLTEDRRPIGTASMTSDRTINLQLRAEAESGMVGEAMLAYPPDHTQYQSILDHLGGLEPGEEKPVLPWPDEPLVA